MRFERPPFRHKPDDRMRHSERPRHTGPQHTNRPDDDEDEEGGIRREAEYLRQLTDGKTPVVVSLVSGENFRGVIEYYDRRFIRLTRTGAPNLFIYKQEIKYLAEE
jgi:sRNA-binding regulator protein Hfq